MVYHCTKGIQGCGLEEVMHSSLSLNFGCDSRGGSFATTLPIVNISMPLEASLSTGVLWAENMFTR